MAGSKILVFGATGPSGINVLRELIHRKQDAVLYARTPSKIPADITESRYIEIVQGGFSPADDAALSRAISQCRAIISLLGPNTGSMKDLTPTTYADIYSQRIFPLMRQHSVKRIFAMNTISVYQPEDKASLLRWLCAIMIWLVAGMAQKNMYAMQELFEDQERSKDIDWTMFRLGFIPGGHDESSWRKDREGEVYVGAVADQGWSLSQKRGQLAKWLVDAAIDGMPHLVHQMPAVSRLAGSRKNAD